MLKLYRQSQTAQYDWIRQHPVQFVTLNVTLTVVAIAFMEYKDRLWLKKMNKIAVQKTQTN